MKTVFDSNIWVSAFAFRGRVRAILFQSLKDKIELITSEEIITETMAVLRRPKIGLPDAVIVAIEAEIREIAWVVRPVERLKVVKRDPDDDRVLECALHSGAGVIVSGDEHLLTLGSYRGMRILSATAFAEEFLGDGPTSSPELDETPARYRAKKKTVRERRRKSDK